MANLKAEGVADGGSLDESVMSELDEQTNAELQTRLKLLRTFEHPITCETLTYASEPVPVNFNSQVQQIK